MCENKVVKKIQFNNFIYFSLFLALLTTTTPFLPIFHTNLIFCIPIAEWIMKYHLFIEIIIYVLILKHITFTKKDRSYFEDVVF